MKTSFKPGWPLTSFFLVFFVLTISLGFWQINRAAFKTQLLQEYDSASQSQPVFPSVNQQAYSHVKIVGQPRQKAQVYWDNRTYQGQAGYEILVPIELTAGDYQWALVNLGWVAGQQNRENLPEVSNLPDQVNWQGILRPLAENWGRGELTNDRRTDYPRLDTIFSNENNWIPYLVELDVAEPFALQRNWQPSVMPPEKHRAYAAQWFTMAVVLTGLFIWAGRKSNRKKQNEQF